MSETVQDAGGGIAGFGRYLVRERELRGLSREDVIRTTRLPASAIEAIETGDAERTPHRAYVMVYLRGYAGAVGLDPDEVVLRYEEAIGPPSEQAKARSGHLARGVLLAVAAVLAGALAWWLARHG